MGLVEPSWGHLGASWAQLRASWGILEPSWGISGPPWGHLGTILGHLGAFLGLLNVISCQKGRKQFLGLFLGQHRTPLARGCREAPTDLFFWFSFVVFCCFSVLFFVFVCGWLWLSHTPGYACPIKASVISASGVLCDLVLALVFSDVPSRKSFEKQRIRYFLNVCRVLKIAI